MSASVARLCHRQKHIAGKIRVDHQSRGRIEMRHDHRWSHLVIEGHRRGADQQLAIRSDHRAVSRHLALQGQERGIDPATTKPRHHCRDFLRRLHTNKCHRAAGCGKMAGDVGCHPAGRDRLPRGVGASHHRC